jgi:outer membrane protein assembly factor BamD
MKTTKIQAKQLIQLLLILALFTFLGCAKDPSYNKSASFWYNKITDSIAQNKLDLADEQYVSLLSEHRFSLLAKSSMMLLANAHMQDRQYILANYYYDEYLEKFADSKMTEYVEFLKLKSKLLALQSRFREQHLISESIDDIEILLSKYDNFAFKYQILDYKTRLLITRSFFNKEIAKLYGRIDKKKAKKYYEKKQEFSAKNTQIQPLGIFRRIFN